MDTVIVNGIELYTLACYLCGCVFSMPVRVNKEFRANHKSFYCPFGHEQCYLQKTKEEELREELVSIRVKNMEILEEKRKLERRAEKGCCPKCGQHIRDLDRHMKRKHR